MFRKKAFSNFPFIENAALRENLDRVIDHILELASVVKSKKYNQVLKSSFRKTVIINTSSVIEALLLYVLKNNRTEANCSKTKKVFHIEKTYMI